MDASEVGRFGTLRLMKRLEPHKMIAAFPIDDEEVTIGRDQDCSIRLYYDSVSPLHCKVIFRERKAFLVVLGTNGVLIDGCAVFPTPGAGGQPVTVPLPNNSQIEINRKCFQFSYPPKELRPTLIDTPTRPDEITPDKRRRRRTLRMSMIQSAQVFTPRPSHDPRENLRILKTPLKSPFPRATGNRRQSSPLKRGVYIPEDDEDEEDEDIVLVESNHPKVVEEDRDLVILEHVVVDVPESEEQLQSTAEQRQLVQFPIPQSAQPPPQMQQTPPRRRPHPRASLHRAVLIRSAQRTALQMEMEREEEREAEEVEETIQEMEELQGLDDEDEEFEDHQEEDQQEQHRSGGPLSGWRKSLGLVTGWALRSPIPRDVREEGDEDEEEQPEDGEGDGPEETPTPEPDDDPMEVEREQAELEEQEEETEHVAPLPPKSPTRHRPLGQFMTPQATRVKDFGFGNKAGSRGHVRYSVGGFVPGGIRGSGVSAVPSTPGTASGPRRVRVVEPWRVQDIVVPVPNEEDEEQEYEEYEENEEPQEPIVTMSPMRRPQVSEEERQAIMDRRRSALQTPDMFAGQVPGARRQSLFPTASPMKSPAKPSPVLHSVTEDTHEQASTSALPSHQEEDEPIESEEDSQVLLARMKQMVEGAKRRQSMGPRPSMGLGLGLTPTPRKSSGFSLLAPDADSTPIRRIEVGSRDQTQASDDEEDVSDKENSAHGAQAGTSAQPAHLGSEDVDMETLVDEDEQEPAQQEERGQEQEQDGEEGDNAEPDAEDGDLEEMGDLEPTSIAHERVAATPSFRGIREMLHERREVATPRMDGMRQLFQTERVMATPSYEGMGEMLEPPPDWQKEDAEKLEEPAPKANPPVRPSALGRGRGARPIPGVGRAPPPTTLRRTAVRSAVASKVAEKVDPPAAQVKASSSKPAPAPAAARVTRKPRGKGTESDTEDAPVAAPTTTRRTRKATASPAPEPEPVPVTLPRRTRSKTPTRQQEDGPTKAATTGRRRAKTPIPEEDEDPINALGRPASPEADAAGSRVRRSARGKLTLAVKEEEEDETPPVRRTVTRAARGRKPMASFTASSAPRSGPRATKSATTKKSTPATAGKQSDANAPNKENTPEPNNSEDEQPEVLVGKSAVRAKATRSVGRTRGESEDVVEKEIPTRVSRVKARK